MYEVIGYKFIKYNRKADGTLVDGIEVYLVGDSDDDRVQGRECIPAYLKRSVSEYISNPQIGDIVKPSYNRYGKMEDLIVLTA